MQIIDLKINCYKSINNLYLDRLFGVNIFIGPNNSGKSNVIDAIESVLMPFNTEQYFADQESNYTLTIQLDQEAKQFLGTADNLLTIKRQGATKTYFLGNQKITNKKFLDNFFINHYVRINSNLIENLDKLRQDYTDLKKNYPKELKSLWKLFNQFFPEIDNILSSEETGDSTKQIAAKLKQGGKIVEFSRLGTGVKHIFAMMLYIIHPRYKLILMNEPETHLHPALIKKISRLLLTNTPNEQVFLTTHSPILITPNNLQQVFRVKKNHEQNTEFYHFTKTDYIDQQRLVQEFNADNLEMFFSDEVVLVEGVSDKILIAGLIEKFYTGTKEIKVISVAGKSNIGIYMQLMDIFKIPYFVLLDRDALYSGMVKEIQEYLPRNKKNRQNQIGHLKQHHIYILPNGPIEKNYPKRYQRRDTKPLNALYAVSKINLSDFNSAVMANLREVIQAL